MTIDELMSVSNGWNRADLMFRNAEASLLKYGVVIDNSFFSQQPIIYIFLAYALLYGVLEFLKEKNSLPPNIVSDVDAVYDDLRLFRNAVSHIQDEFVSHKTLSLLLSDMNIQRRLRKIHDETGVFLNSLA